MSSSALQGRPVRESLSEYTQVMLPNDANTHGSVLGGHIMHLIDSLWCSRGGAAHPEDSSDRIRKQNELFASRPRRAVTHLEVQSEPGAPHVDGSRSKGLG